MSRLSATVLILEAIVIALTIVPAVKLEDATPVAAGLAAGVATVAAIVLAWHGACSRSPWWAAVCFRRW